MNRRQVEGHPSSFEDGRGAKEEDCGQYEQSYLDAMDAEIDDLGQIESGLFQQLKDCIKKATLLKRKYRKLL